MADLTVSKTILAQLGGEGFVMMTGATGFIASADGLNFKLGSNPKRVTHVRVTLTPDGLFDMTFFSKAFRHQLAIRPGNRYLSGSMRPPKKKSAAAKLRRWRVSILRSRAHNLGTIEATDAKAAEAFAVKTFGLTEEQRNCRSGSDRDRQEPIMIYGPKALGVSVGTLSATVLC